MITQEYRLKPFGESLNKVSAKSRIKGSMIELEYHVELSSFLDLWDKDDAVLTRKTGLWEGTCFEAFFQNSKTGEYVEFNFSGTGFWNVFAFKERHQELTEYDKLQIKKHRFITEPKKRTFSFAFDLEQLPFEIASQNLKVGITSILVNEDQEKEYFALGHYQEKPDFHDPQSFIELKS